MDSLNAQFKKIRLEHGFTQKQVADGLNIPEQGYQRYEYGKVVPSALVLIALADFYDVPSTTSLAVQMIPCGDNSA